jgi:hypothetical protein
MGCFFHWDSPYEAKFSGGGLKKAGPLTGQDSFSILKSFLLTTDFRVAVCTNICNRSGDRISDQDD